MIIFLVVGRRMVLPAGVVSCAAAWMTPVIIVNVSAERGHEAFASVGLAQTE
jgi:hypothetical protein